MFGNKFGYKFDSKPVYRTKVNPSGFLAKTTSLYQRAARLWIFWYVYLLPKFDVNILQKGTPYTMAAMSVIFGLLFVAEIWCKQVVYVQTYGLHRRSMNAPTMLIYEYIYL